MISEDDGALYFHLARSSAAPDREFVEVGTWLGRSTTRICQGLSQSGTDWKLTCFDRFIWDASHVPKARIDGVLIPEVRDLKAGDSFRQAFVSLLGPYADHVSVLTGELKDVGRVLGPALSPEMPIGVLFVDASKGWNNNALLSCVAGHLVAGPRASTLVFQDFFMWSAYSLQFMLMMVPEIEPVMFSSRGGCCVFRVVQPLIKSQWVLRPKSFKSVTKDHIFAAWDRLNSFIPPERIELDALAVGLPLMLWSRDFKDEAMEVARNTVLSEEQHRKVAARIAGSSRHLATPLLEVILGTEPVRQRPEN